MTLDAALERITRDWVALTPRTRPNRSFHCLDAYQVDVEPEVGRFARDLTLDRGFYFEVQTRTTEEEASDALARVRYVVQVTVMAALGEVTLPAVIKSLRQDTSQLARAIDVRSTWPTGVLEVETRDTTYNEPDEEAGLASATMELSVFVEED